MSKVLQFQNLVFRASGSEAFLKGFIGGFGPGRFGQAGSDFRSIESLVTCSEVDYYYVASVCVCVAACKL